LIREILSTTPYPDHVQIGFGRHVHELLELLNSHSVSQRVHGNHVDPAREETDIVY